MGGVDFLLIIFRKVGGEGEGLGGWKEFEVSGVWRSFRRDGDNIWLS